MRRNIVMTDDNAVWARCAFAAGARIVDIRKTFDIQNIQVQRLLVRFPESYEPHPDADPLPTPGQAGPTTTATHRKVVAALRSADRATMMTPSMLRAISSTRAVVVDAASEARGAYTDHVITVRVFRRPMRAPATP